MSAFTSRPPTRTIVATRLARHLLWFVLVLTTLSMIVRFQVAGSSQSILAIALDDLVEIVSAIAMLVAIKLEDRPRSAQRPLGYRGVGAIASAISALMITIAGLYIVYDATTSLIAGPQPISGTVNILDFELWRGWWLAIIAFATTLYSPWAYWQERPIARDMEWDALQTDAAAHVVSTFNGIAALVGIMLGAIGLHWGDPAAALLIGIVFLYEGYTDVKRAASQLLNERPLDETLDKLSAIVVSKPYVRDHRWMVWVQDNYIDGVLFIAAPDCRLSLTEEWREELQRELRQANWHIDDLVISFGTQIPPSAPPDPHAESEPLERGQARDAA